MLDLNAFALAPLQSIGQANDKSAAHSTLDRGAALKIDRHRTHRYPAAFLERLWPAR
jgi:hypothetical protein